jgi:hypothetical protein
MPEQCFRAALALLVAAGLSAGAEPPAAEPHPRPKPVPATPPAVLEQTIGRGVAFLLREQHKAGFWGTPRWTGGVDSDALPAHHSFQVATTALCLEALLEVGGEGPEVKRALQRGEAWLLDNLPKLRRAAAGEIPNIWGHAYGIQTLTLLHRRCPDDAARRLRLENLIREQVAFLKRFETVNGGWFYYSYGTQRPWTTPASFVNAAVLVALYRAREIGISLPEKVVERALQSTRDQRKPDGSYLYDIDTKLSLAGAMRPINRPSGSLGRAQACNLALRLWGDAPITDAVLKTWLDRLCARNGWLDMGRKKPIPHESFAQVAGYFFYFGHYYGALCIEQLPAAERPFYQDQLAHLLIPLQEKDGSWWDYPLYGYGKPYGTAFALLSLKCCRKAAGGGAADR